MKFLVPALLMCLAPVTITQAASAQDLARGKYLVQITGCNDCHTPGYAQLGGEVDEAQWLTGEVFGWNGPWGTTYATNLRLRMQELSESEWIELAHTLKARPPMPWFSLNKISSADLRAMYRYIRHLGPAGQPAPAYLKPGIAPPPPFATFPAPPPGAVPPG